jgi:hypothetical protein
MIIDKVYSIEDDEETQVFYINFDLSNEEFKYKNESEKIENIVVKNTNIVALPKILLVKEGFYFNGWTSDFVYGYAPGDNFTPKEKNTTLYPIFEDKNDTTYFRLEYKVEFEGENIDISKKIWPSTERAKSLKTIRLYTYTNEKGSTQGWTDGTHEFYYYHKLVMPRKNVTLYAIFHNFVYFSYSHGDVDGIIGNPEAPFKYLEGGIVDLAESTRLRRRGYTIVGWHCDYDGKDYPIFYRYVLPDADVVMTAIWEPIEYNILFMTRVREIPNIRIKGKTEEVISVPNIEEKREGFVFNGWNFEGIQYQPGDEFIIKGQDPGIGISAEALWIQT